MPNQIWLKWRGKLLTILPWLIIAFFAYLYIRIGFLNEIQLQNGEDLGTYNQILYNISHGHIPPFNSLKNEIAWGDHAHFILLLVAPFYRLFWPAPQFVLAFQALALTTSGWALYQIAQDKIRNYLFSFVLLVAYLMFFGVQDALNFDFHANVLTTAILAWSFYAWHRQKPVLFWITVALGLLTREDASLFYFMFGVWITIVSYKQHRRAGGALMGISLLYFFVVTYGLMPRWSSSGTALAYFDSPGPDWGPAKILAWLLTHPLQIFHTITDTGTKVKTLRYLVEGFGFLSLLSPFTYLLAAPNILARFLSGEYQQHLPSMYHYNASISSILAYGAILGTSNLLALVKRFRPFRYDRIAVVLAAVLLMLIGGFFRSWLDRDLPLHHLQQPEFTQHKYQPRLTIGALYIIREMIPLNQSVSASSGLVPQLSSRSYIFNFPDPLPAHAQWVVLSPEFNTWPLPRGEVEGYITDFEHNDNYELVWRDYGLWVFKYKGTDIWRPTKPK